MRILYISASPMGEKSISRELGENFLSHVNEKYDDVIIVERDLSSNPIPHLTLEALCAFDNKEPDEKAQKLVQLSNNLIDEIFEADLILISTPMWNFGIPSVLKAWIDYIVRAGKTFNYTENGFTGLITNKKLVTICARGGIYSDGPYKRLEHEESYLQSIFTFLGITDIAMIHAEGVAYGPDSLAKAKADAIKNIENLVKSL